MANSVDLRPEYPQGSADQRGLLFNGQKAAVSTAVKTYANLANNQTLIVAETNGASPPVPVLKTFEIEKSASGWTPTGGAVVVIDCTAADTLVALLAIVRDFLNARPNAAYTWAINDSNDGLVGTAKLPGEAWNVIPYGTTLIGNIGSITTTGTEPTPSYNAKIEGLASPGWQDSVAKLFDLYAPNTTKWGYVKPGSYPLGRATLPSGMSDPHLSGGPIRVTSTTGIYWSSDILPAGGMTAQCWGVAFHIKTLPAINVSESVRIGLFNAAGNKLIMLANDWASDPAHTKWVYVANNGGTPTVIRDCPTVDTAEHTIALTFDTTTLRMFYDGVLYFTSTDTSQFPSGAVAPYICGGTNMYIDVYQIAWRV